MLLGTDHILITRETFNKYNILKIRIKKSEPDLPCRSAHQRRKTCLWGAIGDLFREYRLTIGHEQLLLFTCKGKVSECLFDLKCGRKKIIGIP